MRQICVFIETKTNDKKRTNEDRFIRHLIHLIDARLDDKIELIGTNGYTNLKEFKNKMLRNSVEGIRNIVVFDADFPETGGGFTKRRKELLDEKTDMQVDFDLFLFPNNNDDGTFEHLLEHLVVENHQGLLNCFQGYEGCIRGYGRPEYISPDQKAKMYSYISTLKKTQTETTAFKNGDWFFEREEIWNFDSEYLSALKEFLINNLL